MRYVIVPMVILLAMLDQSSEADTPPCNGKVDILFMIDASNSVKAIYFELEKQFVADIATNFDLGAEKNLISLMVFSNEAIIVFPFNPTMTHIDIQQAVMKARFSTGGTYPAEAFKLAREKAFTSSNGARQGAKKVVVLLMYGQSANRFTTLEEATSLKNTDVIINVVGIGSKTDQVEIKNISSGERYIFSAESFDVLDNVQKGITNNICAVIPSCMIDLIFAIDASKYVGAEAFELVKMFVIGISNKLVLGAENTVISLVLIKFEDAIVFPFNATMTHNDIQQAVMKVPYKGGTQAYGSDYLHILSGAFRSYNKGRPGANKVYVKIQGLVDSEVKGYTLKNANVSITVIGKRAPDAFDSVRYIAFIHPSDLKNKQTNVVNSVKKVCEDPPPCMTDFIFMLDASPKLGAIVFDQEKKFFAELSKTIHVGGEKDLICMRVFRENAAPVFLFNDTMTQQDIQQAVSNVPYKGDPYDYSKALDKAKYSFIPVLGARVGVNQVIITYSLSESLSRDMGVTNEDVYVLIKVHVKRAHDISMTEKYWVGVSSPHNYYTLKEIINNAKDMCVEEMP